MIILHAAFWDGELCVWGETPIETEEVKPARGGRRKAGQSEALEAGQDSAPASRRSGRAKSGKVSTSAYPYDAGYEALAAALLEGNTGIKPRKKDCQQAALWLPTRGGLPAPSSPLIAEPITSKAKWSLEAWTVTTLFPSPEELFPFLAACFGRRTLAPGVIIGPDIGFWTQVMRFAGSLVARQNYLPSLETRGEVPRACWRPVLGGSDNTRLATLASMLPPIARAVAPTDNTEAPDMPARWVVETFLGTLVDRLVRSALADTTSSRSTKAGAGKKSTTFESVHDLWLSALRSADGVLTGPDVDVHTLVSAIEDWRRPITVSAASPYRLCFRLEEPIDDETGRAERVARDDWTARADWSVRYLVQATDDPSLLVPVAEAWKARGQKAALFHREGFNLKEYLLSSLGQAAGFCPNIEKSLKTAVPDGYRLDSTGAHEFLTTRSAVLEQAGFGVLLPAWWTRKGTKLRLSARANVKASKFQGGSGISLGEIVQIDWEVALGDERLSMEELEALAKLKAPLVKVRGQWVELNAEEIKAALALWKKKGGEQVTVREVIRMALGGRTDAQGLSFAGVKADGWVAELLEKLNQPTGLEEVAAPSSFVGRLRPYQVRGLSWLAFLRQWGLGACLADDMGLGKTIQTLALIQRDWSVNGKKPVLLICPTSVVNNWQKEAARFTPELPVMIHHGPTRNKGAAFRKEADDHAIVISSYALLHRDMAHLQKVTWGGIVLDEAQNVKNAETKQSKAARALSADYRIALTGTPVENNVGDLWSIMEFLNPGFLGTQAAFRRDFFVPIQTNRDPEAPGRLKGLTGPFILRRLKTDKAIISDLPEKLEMKVFCTLTREQASLYAAVLKDAEEALEDSDGMKRRGVILATLSKLKQVCNHPAQFLGDNSAIPDRSGKLSRIVEMLEIILEMGERALIFTQFSEMGTILERHIRNTFGIETLFLHGAVPKKKRDQMVERFQAEGRGPSVFILSLKAGGTGLNLTRANHVFHFDRWWNPAVENQATDRAFRIGQEKQVQVHKFLCAGTLEEKIDEMIERKQDIAEKVVGTGESWLTEMSNQELKQIFALRSEAIGE